MRNIIRDIFEMIATSYWGAVLLMLYGVFLIIWSYKERNDPEAKRGFYILGWGSAIGAVIASILIVLFKLLGKL